MDVRVTFDDPAAGAWNMAMDEALFESAGRAGQGGCLRFYLWNEPTLSLGYFQRHADRVRHAASRDCPMVRRATGGGAILHAHELTYSLTVPLATRGDQDAMRLYLDVHETLIDELAARGMSSTLCGNLQHLPAAEEPFLCFLRRSEADVLMAGHKVAGSAQRRRRWGLLQHGSVLLRTSPCSPELVGIEDLCGRTIEPREFAQRWAKRLGNRLNLRLHEAPHSDQETAAARIWLTDRFECGSWNCKR